MIILSELNKPYSITSLTQPLPEGSRYYWIFNAVLLDFLQNNITHIEETTGPTITLLIDGTELKVPGSWHILVLNKETYTVDTVPVTACAAFNHDAFVFSPNDSKLMTAKVSAIDFNELQSCQYPALNKGIALVHCISPCASHNKEIQRGVIIGPHELYKHLNGCTVGDILG